MALLGPGNVNRKDCAALRRLTPMNQLKITIFASMALAGLSNSVILPILAPMIRDLRLSESQGGWMVSIGSIAMVVLATIWGAASDRFGRKPIMLAGFGGMCVAYALYTSVVWFGLTGVLSGLALFALLVACRALIGAFLPAVPAAAQALMADNTGTSDRSSGMAVISAASGVGLVFGPALGGALALNGLIWPLLLTTVLCGAAVFMVQFAVPSAPPKLREKPEPINPFSGNLLPWLLTGVMTMCAIVTVQITAGFYFQDRLGLTTAETGPMLAIALTLVGVGLLITQILQVRVLRWPPRRMILVGVVFWIAGLLILLGTASALSYYLAYGVMGVGSGLLMPGYMSGASLAVPAERQGAVAGFAAATQGIGGVVAPVASTMLYEIDMALPLWCIIGVLAMIFVLFTVTSLSARLAAN